MAEALPPGGTAIRELAAPVRPRGRAGGSGSSGGSGEVLPLEDLVLPVIHAHGSGTVAIVGPLGSGKTTALEHLAAVLPREARAWVHLLDEPGDAQARELAGQAIVVYTTTQRPPANTGLLTVDLAPWSQDDVIEYLLSRHPAQCAGVMARLKNDDSVPRLNGSPELWRLVLDEMAADDTLTNFTLALAKRIDTLVPEWNLHRQAGELGLFWLLRGKGRISVPVLTSPLPLEVRRLAHHRYTSLLLAAGLIAADLDLKRDEEYWSLPLPRDLIEIVANWVRGRKDALNGLRSLARRSRPEAQPMAISVLAAADPAWQPRRGWPRHLAGACLPSVRWAGANLQRADLSGADLMRADLSGANLRRSRMQGTGLRLARLSRAVISRAAAAGADFSQADMSFVRAVGTNFQRAVLDRAHLTAAVLRKTDLNRASLVAAVLRGADLRGAVLERTQLIGADMADADLTGAHLENVCLRDVRLAGARFNQATLVDCDLEGLDLPDAKFARAILSRCLLTASVMPRADFSGADLTAAGLAEIEWENADLRNANLKHAAFHMGSSRSGRVGSLTPCEGSRTGFYSDEFTEQSFRSPEEIRKANLRGADLRGAAVMDADFYLVDLREAKYTPEQGQHFARCGAILVDRVG